MDLEQIGERIFGFMLYYSVIITVITLTLISAGIPVDAFDLPLFTPANRFYEMTMAIAAKLPTNATITSFLFGLSFGIVGAAVQLLTTLVTGVLALIQTIAMLIPPDVRFLVVPLYFVGSFVQVVVWYYLAVKIYNLLKSWIPFSWGG